MAASSATDARDRAIAKFFDTAAQLLEMCKPLVKSAVAQALLKK